MSKLTDERIFEIWRTVDFDDRLEGRISRFARAIEVEVGKAVA